MYICIYIIYIYICKYIYVYIYICIYIIYICAQQSGTRHLMGLYSDWDGILGFIVMVYIAINPDWDGLCSLYDGIWDFQRSLLKWDDFENHHW